MTDTNGRITAATLARRLGTTSASAGGPGYRALATRIRSAVLDGRLAVGTGLPSERELARVSDLSRTTVTAAYALLRQQGWLQSRRGSGSRIVLPAADATRLGPAGHPGGAVLGSARWAPEAVDSALTGSRLLDLGRACLPAPEQQLRIALAEATQDLDEYLSGDGYWPYGLPVLRQAVADAYAARGVPTGPDEILITSGAQHAFVLCAEELSAPGERVVVECPTYPVVLDALRQRRRTPLPIGLAEPVATDRPAGQVGASAWDIDLFLEAFTSTTPRLAYLMPDFQNPTGALMSEVDRDRMVAGAAAAGVTLLVDESFRDLPSNRGGSVPLPPPMAAFGPASRVVSLGSMSKALWGGLRVGWIRAAPPLVHRLAATRALGDMAGPVLDQLIVARVLADPQPVLAVQRERLAVGLHALTSALTRWLPDWHYAEPAGGVSLWVRLPGPFALELAQLALAVDVRIAPGPRFGPDGTMESYLRLPFTLPADVLTEAVQRLATVAGRAAASGPSGPAGWIA